MGSTLGMGGRAARTVAGAVAMAAVVSATGGAAASLLCGTRERIVKTLADRYGESRRALGLQNGKRVLELFASAGGSWTAVLTDPAGRACIVGAGEAWTEFEPEPAGPRAEGPPAAGAAPAIPPT